MKHILFLISMGLLICSLACGGSASSLKLGNCPLTVTVKADGTDFDGFANVYIGGKLIGTTDANTKQLRVNLKKGEYTVIVVAEGYKPWRGKVLLLGDGYKQNVLARLRLGTEETTENK